ncbi:mannonate dehydratase [Vibrio nitrifigilis]|uniref:Mannonate dehydratase n=1 Tax=Vibrio nitrifigilis TaxID=2789781 RepID=A0ABS0GM68_9VIBR|nr:mannonate dehydratase [Vibrio nitrifigilis]MBF9003400.1 mannonate dehydratase [Vibrio nitrifigilis]
MRMTFRWYGEGNDKISLAQIRQIPGVDGIVWSLHDMPAGELWSEERITKEIATIRQAGFHADVVESVNVHEDIKLGLPTRDVYIDNYKETLRRLAKAGVKVVCYNFMPVFDWTRTELYHPLEDGSNALFFEQSRIQNIDPMELIKTLSQNVDVTMPGWEPERLAKLEHTFVQYQGFTSEQLWSNLQYFLEQVIPVCEQYDIKLGIHPDDPAFAIFGLPRIITNLTNIKRLLSLVDSPYNGLSLCTGSLGSINNDIPAIIDQCFSRIHFMHVRNVKRFANGDFIETSHRACDGSVDTVKVIKTLHKHGYTGYLRPDHGRHLWGEEEWARPGYGLYDRALGIMYLLGVWDSLES